MGRQTVVGGDYGGANIEMGGATQNQLVEYVRSFDPRGWSCLHIAEGGQNCVGATVQNNDIGPCGNDKWVQWADGVSFACRDGVVQNNLIENPTDGGIVLFGSPGTRVENNTIWVVNVRMCKYTRRGVLTCFQNTLIGGINMVDFSPWGGNYSGVVVTNNILVGGFAETSSDGNTTKGDDLEDVIIK